MTKLGRITDYSTYLTTHLSINFVSDLLTSYKKVTLLAVVRVYGSIYY
jgi:hypothetical protein